MKMLKSLGGSLVAFLSLMFAASGAFAQTQYADAVTALSTMEADVLAVGLAGIAVFVIVRGFSWAKGALS